MKRGSLVNFIPGLTIFGILLIFGSSCRGPVTKVSVQPVKKDTIVDPRLSLPLEEQLKLRIYDELAKGISNDTIILDHVFGMSRREVIRHKEKLVKAKRIYPVYKTKNTRAFVYDLNLPKSGKLSTYFDTFYHEDKLYIMECKPKIPKGTTAAEVWEEVMELYEMKYGEPHFEFAPESKEDCPRSFWVMGNQQIELKCKKGETLIEYKDLKRTQERLQDI